MAMPVIDLIQVAQHIKEVSHCKGGRRENPFFLILRQTAIIVFMGASQLGPQFVWHTAKKVGLTRMIPLLKVFMHLS